MSGLARGGFYAILNLLPPADGFWPYLPAGKAEPWPEALIQAQGLLAAKPCCLQLRAKEAPAALLYALAMRLLPVCRDAGIPLCINDRVDVAVAVGADFAHVGQDDLPAKEARKVIELCTAPAGAPALAVGVSTHSLAQAEQAVAAGADLIGFGPVFATGTKENPDPVVGVDQLRAVVQAVSVPVIAIGGITLDNVADVAATGARAAAVISAVSSAPDPTAAGRQINAAFGV